MSLISPAPRRIQSFAELLGDSRAYTLHSHTQFCDGRADMATMARAAVDAGFTVYGFSPHSPIPFPSSCNMTEADVPAYLAEVSRIAGSPLGRSTRFLPSMEIDYISPDWGPSSPFFQSLPLSYSIGSVHFIPDQSGEYVDIDGSFDSFKVKMDQHFHSDIRYVVETFFRHSHQMLDAGGFDIIGHFDKVGQNASYYSPGIEQLSWYRALHDSLTDHVIASGVVVEINTKALIQHSRFFPTRRIWKRLIDAGVEIVVNSDAHYPDRINLGRDEALAILDSLRS